MQWRIKQRNLAGMTGMDSHALNGKPFTLLLMGTTPDGKDDWAVFPGVARVEEDGLYIDRGPKARFKIRPEWVSRIRPVDASLRSTLRDAEYYLPLTVGSLASGGNDDDLLRTSLKWPD
jgi:hypothetical protein